MTAKGEITRTKILDGAQGLIMKQGFAGTSIDDILSTSGVTKGAFFHQFKGKAQLARALVERYAMTDLKLFEGFLNEVKAESSDPLVQAISFLRKFEAYIEGALDDDAPGCMYAVYTYESAQFDAEILNIVSDTLRKWTSIYVRKYQEVIDAYPPAIDVTARQLAELTVSIVEGGIILQRAHGDNGATNRQSEQLRNYLHLLFGEPRAVAA